MRISKPKHVMTVYRRILDKSKFVYLLLSNNPHRYARGRSRIVYIGTTRRGVGRVAGSVAQRAEECFDGRGRKRMDVHVVACSPVPGLKSWRLLERALLAEFQSSHLELPVCNAQGKGYAWNGKLQRYLRRERVRKLLEEFEG